MSTSVSGLSTNFFPSAQDGFTTTLASSISSGAATVPLNSVAGYTNGQVAVFVVDPSSTLKQAFTGIVDTAGVQVTSVVWTSGTNQAHAGGATVVDYETATHWSMVAKGILKQHTQAGAHTGVTTDTLAASGNATVGGTLGVTGLLTTTGGLATNNTVAAKNLATNAITLNYAQITSTLTTSSTSLIYATGIGVAVTIPAGGRRVKITVFLNNVNQGTSSKTWTWAVYSGATVGTLTTLLNTGTQGVVFSGASVQLTTILTPSAGAIAYSLAWSSDSGGGVTATINAASTSPSYILVETI